MCSNSSFQTHWTMFKNKFWNDLALVFYNGSKIGFQKIWDAFEILFSNTLNIDRKQFSNNLALVLKQFENRFSKDIRCARNPVFIHIDWQLKTNFWTTLLLYLFFYNGSKTGFRKTWDTFKICFRTH